MDTSFIKNIDSTLLTQTIGKLSNDNITNIIISAMAAGSLCYMCKEGGCIEITHKDSKIVLNGNKAVA